jgi:hypothetical protein
MQGAAVVLANGSWRFGAETLPAAIVSSINAA